MGEEIVTTTPIGLVPTAASCMGSGYETYETRKSSSGKASENCSNTVEIDYKLHILFSKIFRAPRTIQTISASMSLTLNWNS